MNRQKPNETPSLTEAEAKAMDPAMKRSPQRQGSRSTKRLTKKERTFLKAIVKGRNQSQAAIAAGYSPKNPDVSGAIAMAQLRRKIPDILTRMGWPVEKVLRDVLVPGLRAKKTELASSQGVFIDSKELVDHEQRGKFFDRYCKLMGLYSETELSSGGIGRPSVTVVIADPERARAIMERLAPTGQVRALEPVLDATRNENPR